MTTYRRDRRGRVVEATTVHDPEWTDEDRAWLLALLAERADTCPGCGHPADEAHNRATERQWQVQTSVCQACLLLEATRDNQREAGTRNRGEYLAVTRRR